MSWPCLHPLLGHRWTFCLINKYIQMCNLSHCRYLSLSLCISLTVSFYLSLYINYVNNTNLVHREPTRWWLHWIVRLNIRGCSHCQKYEKLLSIYLCMYVCMIYMYILNYLDKPGKKTMRTGGQIRKWIQTRSRHSVRFIYWNNTRDNLPHIHCLG